MSGSRSIQKKKEGNSLTAKAILSIILKGEDGNPTGIKSGTIQTKTSQTNKIDIYRPTGEEPEIQINNIELPERKEKHRERMNRIVMTGSSRAHMKPEFRFVSL